MANPGMSTRTRLIVISTGLVAAIALIAAVVMYGRAQREAARESVALQRAALANDPVALAGSLYMYAFLSSFTHMNFFGSSESPDFCDMVKDGKCERLLLDAARFVVVSR